MHGTCSIWLKDLLLQVELLIGLLTRLGVFQVLPQPASSTFLDHAGSLYASAVICTALQILPMHFQVPMLTKNVMCCADW